MEVPATKKLVLKARQGRAEPADCFSQLLSLLASVVDLQGGQWVPGWVWLE